ncbi:hypothetical protein GIB67_014641 [Kingdonia uniflora]|uniref:Pentatricopeptide repeat-containing protein n=1 Tax=Kingdonia uniflora TaxID=39325 RepID=A0A7J7NV32_9MAGN|nr:hypothetical protein GIB67_014641 [Kingdonia uniflora]
MLITFSRHNKHTQTLKLFSSLVSDSASTYTVKPDGITISVVLKALSLSLFGELEVGKMIHGFVVKHGYACDVFVGNGLVTFYAKSDDLGSSRMLFDEMGEKDIVSWNAMIAGYSQGGLYVECLELYREMVDVEGLRPNEVTVVSVFQACAQLKDIDFGKEVYRYIVENNVEVDTLVYNSIIGFYAKCGELEYAKELFEEVREKDEVTYGSMISGYMIYGFVDKAIELFREMKNPALSTWNVVVSGLVQNNQHEGIPELLREMQAMGFTPNSVTLSSVLPTFSYFSNLKGGKQIHCYAIRNNYDTNVYITTALIDTYAKAGFLGGARKLFIQCKMKGVIIWTAIISAYAAHGDADEALTLFWEMLSSGTRPDPVTFTAVLSACAHSGCVDEARRIFDTMFLKYGIHPLVEQYACMVGVLSRAGMLYEAKEFIFKMPIEPSSKVWGALLNGVAVSGDVELGKFVCERLFEIEPENTGNYIIMANLYSQAGRWDESEEIREKMKNLGLKKIPGCSWIETSDGSHSFVAGNRSNERVEEIYCLLEEIVENMREESYVYTMELDDESICS